ncbi:YncE family protein [Williamsia sp. MIQD14]|uniref:YncE family protein n=1 Tax=Williamsia sp. MIQD14 TaxID=3425703 RepID=UPI003DA0F2F7
MSAPDGASVYTPTAPMVDLTEANSSASQLGEAGPMAPAVPQPWNPIGTFVTALLQQLVASVRDTFLANPIAQAIWAQFRPTEQSSLRVNAPVTAGAPPTTSRPVTQIAAATTQTSDASAAGSLADAGGQLIGPYTANLFALSRDGTRGYASVTTYDQTTNQTTYYVQQVNPATQQPVGARIELPGRITALALTQQGDRLYVTTADAVRGGAVNTIDTRTNTASSAPIFLEYAEPAAGIAVSSDGNTVYFEAANTGIGNGNGDVFAVNTKTGSITTIPSGYPVVTGPVVLDETNGRIYAGKTDGTFNYGQVSVTNLQTGQIATIYVGGSPTELVLSDDGRTLYGNLLQGGLFAIDTTTLTVSKYYTVPLAPSAQKYMALSPDGKYLSVAGIAAPGGSTVIEIDTATGEGVGVVTGLDYSIYSLRYRPDGGLLYAVGTRNDSGGYFGSLSTTTGNPTDGTDGGGTTNPGSGTGTGGTTTPGTGSAGENIANFFSGLSFALDLLAGTHAAEVLGPVGAVFSGINIVAGIANLAVGTANNNPYQQVGGALQLVGGTLGLLALIPGPTALPLAALGIALDVTGILVSQLEAATTPQAVTV